MNLVHHIGLSSSNPYSSVELFRATLIVIIVGVSWLAYHIISAVSHAGGLLFPALFTLLNRRAASIFWEVCLFCLEQNGIEMQITGDSFASVESALVVANHRLLADFIVIAYLLKLVSQDSVGSPRLNFITWATLWRVPGVRLFLSMLSVNENWFMDEATTEAQLAKLDTFLSNPDASTFLPEWLVVFPEVTIYSSIDLLAQRHLLERYLSPRLENVLYPRLALFRGVTSGIRRLDMEIDKMYSVTMVYFSKSLGQSVTPTLLGFISQCPSDVVVRVHVRARPLDKVPVKERKMDRWLENEWVERDRLVGGIIALKR